MQSRKRVVAWGSVLVLCAAISAIGLLTEKSSPTRQLSVPKLEAAEGTAEDPYARARYRWMQLRNPETNAIPRNIGIRENAYARRLAQPSGSRVGPVVQAWRPRGPVNIGGRTKALALDVLNENIIVAGGVSSGMWKSTDGGQSWNKTTAPDQLHSVSCIAQNQAPGREHIWYYGTGEGTSGRGGSAAGPLMTDAFYRGDGIFKSVDGGDSWSLLPSTVSGTATETDPFDYVWSLATFGTDGVYAATSSGLFMSMDAGETWDHVLDFGSQYRNTEVAVAPEGTVYATIGGDGPDSGIYQSTDGEHWDDISPPDWPETTIRTLIGLVPSNPNKVFFFTCEDHLKTHLYRYTEGEGWTDLRPNLPWGGDLITYGGNMLLLKVKPDDEDTIFLGAIGLYRSRDGGQSFEQIGGHIPFHVDQHSLVFYPSDLKRMIVGNDGGLFRTEDNTADTIFDPRSGDRIDWQPLNNGYLTTQFYGVAIDHATPGSEIISGGMQDNGCMLTTSSDPAAPWQLLWDGDGGFSAICDGGQYHYTSMGATFHVMRHTFENGEHRFAEVTPASGRAGLWLPPFLLDPHDTRIMYLPSREDLWRNSDLTEIPYVFPTAPTDVNWTQLENVQGDYISAFGMSEAMPRRLYYGSIFGALLRIDNPHEGQPIPVRLSEAHPWPAYVHCIAVDPFDVDKLIIVFPNYELLSIFASEDGGQHWAPVSGNLEEHPTGHGDGPSVRWVSILYVDDHPVYFAGTSVGLFSTTRLDGTNTVWVQEGGDTIGNVVVDMIDVRQSDGYVVVGTHGNGVYSTTLTEIPPAVFYFPQIGDGKLGEASFQTTLALYNAGLETPAKIEFFDSSGVPLPVSLGALGSGTQIEFVLGAGESVSAQTPGTGELKVGYAKVTTGVGVDGTAVFSYKEKGITQYEAGVPSAAGATDFTIFVDKSEATRDTGLALVNVGDGLSLTTFRLYSTAFQLVATRSVSALDPNFASGHHLAKYASEIFSEIEQQGLTEAIITVESDQPLAAVTLRQRWDPVHPYPASVTTLSAFPVFPGRADHPQAAQINAVADPVVFYLPQVGSGTTGGASFTTGFILLNTGPAAWATVDFYSSDGTKMTVNLGPHGSNDHFNLDLGEGEAISVETVASGGLQVGYARVLAPLSVGGAAVFAYARSGVTFFETGVPAVFPRKNFAIFMDASELSRDTGIALVNAGTADAEGDLQLFDPSHSLTAGKSLEAFGATLEASCHSARYATELFPEIRQQNIAYGVIEVFSSQPLAALTLRQHFDATKPFPQDLYLLTTFPVIRLGLE